MTRTTSGRSGIQLTVGLMARDATTVRVFDAQGERDRVDHLYEIGSITKTFTASLLAKQVSEGRMSLDDPLARHLDWLDPSVFSPPLSRIASHTAGYSATAPLTRTQYATVIVDLIRGKNQHRNPLGVSEERFRRLAQRARPTDREHGWSYSNLGYALLGRAIGTAGGRDYTALMTAYLRDELALTNTRVGTDPASNLHGATRRGADCGNWQWAAHDYEPLRPAGAISSTAEDLLTYARFCMKEQNGYLSMLLDRRAGISKRDEMGLGWWLLRDADRVIHHGGGTGSFSSFLIVDLTRNTAAVVLANQRLSRSADRQIAESLLHDLPS